MYAYSYDGMCFRVVDNPSWLLAGEVYFDHTPSSSELQNVFPGYLTAMTLKAAAISYNAALRAGVTVQSLSNSNINGVYACDESTQQRITSEAVYVQVTGQFSTATDNRGWPNINGAQQGFTTSQFLAFATLIAKYVTALGEALQASAAGAAWQAPPSTIQIP